MNPDTSSDDGLRAPTGGFPARLGSIVLSQKAGIATGGQGKWQGVTYTEAGGPDWHMALEWVTLLGPPDLLASLCPKTQGCISSPYMLT